MPAHDISARDTGAHDPSARDDLALLIHAARAAAEVALRYPGPTPVLHDKPDGQGPVTEADLAVDALLHARLTGARPGYGWLSEETPDTPDRLTRDRVFIVDPIDGTRAFVDGQDAWAHSLAVAERGVVIAAVIHMPAKDRLYAAALGQGATCNGTPIRPAGQAMLAGARSLASRQSYEAQHWHAPQPQFDRHYRPSLAWRLALVADGTFDLTLTLRPTWEWDIAAGALILTEAGAAISDRRGAPLRFNNPHPQLDGTVAANPALHGALIAALR